MVNPTQNSKDWWAPVWKGLILDKDGKHYRKMKAALWLFLYCILCADRKTGILRKKASTIGQDMGVKIRTIREWLRILGRTGYIYPQNNGRCLSISIKKWKTFSECHYIGNQSDKSMEGRVTKYCHSEGDQNGRPFSRLSQILADRPDFNDITLKIDLNKNDNVIDKTGNASGLKEARDLLALEICRAFKDKENLPLYLNYVKRYPIEIIQKAFKETQKMPLNKIKKTRGALFTYLVKYYGNDSNTAENFSH